MGAAVGRGEGRCCGRRVRKEVEAAGKVPTQARRHVHGLDGDGLCKGQGAPLEREEHLSVGRAVPG